MASPNISLLGATYNGVAGVTLPKSGGGTATFPWVEGSQTYTTNGTYDVSGLAEAVVSVSGGGGSTPVWGILRPDAELVQTYTYDHLLISESLATKPSYSTQSQTLVSSANLSPTVTVDLGTYDYGVVVDALIYPIYNTATKSKGKPEYYLAHATYEVSNILAGQFNTLDGTKTNGALNVMSSATLTYLLYWSSATAVGGTTSGTYGTYCTLSAPTMSAPTLTIKSPAWMMRGSTTYCTSTNWGYITDIRAQYLIRVYRVAQSTGVRGWYLNSGMQHLAGNVNSANHTLTT